jgi:hypothetical protein
MSIDEKMKDRREKEYVEYVADGPIIYFKVGPKSAHK